MGEKPNYYEEWIRVLAEVAKLKQDNEVLYRDNVAISEAADRLRKERDEAYLRGAEVALRWAADDTWWNERDKSDYIKRGLEAVGVK